MNELSLTPELSIVAPMYNEEGNVAAFVAAVEKVALGLGVPFEIVLVDDGSSDGTWQTIVRESALHPHLRGARLARNFGHQGALLAGLSEARGKAIVSMDGDLQHPPELIPELFARWREGYKVVTTERADAEDTSLFKRTSSRWFYGVFSRLTGVAMGPGNSDFRLLDESAVRALCEMNDVDLFIHQVHDDRNRRVPRHVLSHRRAIHENPIVAAFRDGGDNLPAKSARVEIGNRQRRAAQQIRHRAQPRELRNDAGNRDPAAVLFEGRLVRHVSRIVGERKQVHVVIGRKRPQLMEGANLVTLIGWKRYAVAEVQDSHAELSDLE